MACLLSAYFLMRALGEQGIVNLACAVNLAVGVTAIVIAFMEPSTPAAIPENTLEQTSGKFIPLWVGVILSGCIGFVSLGYEIVWFRVFSVASGGTAPCFALLLGFYLLGIAYGSLQVRDFSAKQVGASVRKKLWNGSIVVLLGTIAAYLVAPALGHAVLYLPYEIGFVFVFVAAALLGSAFPLIADAAISSRVGTGKSLSFLYLSNIVGSTAGSFLVGFVVLDRFSTSTTCNLLLLLGFGIYIVLTFASKPAGKTRFVAASCTACVLLLFSSHILYGRLYDRLVLKRYARDNSFADVVENRSGVIGVLPEGIVFGGGVYDGRFSTDLVHDTNGIFRAFAIAGMHPHPSRVLIIGLSSGSWAQVVANDPEVKEITIVEINPGYLPLIRKHPEVAGLLDNPKVHVVIDDGRRWLVSHPGQKFDLILMNTTFNWRANNTNLLSREFLTLVRTHLNEGGIEYYNTTSSEQVMATGGTVFPYSLRVGNFLAVSDSPISLDKARWREALIGYQVDGHPVFNLSNSADIAKLDELLSFVDQVDKPGGVYETGASLRGRLASVRIITDDNMGTEWSGSH
jgi:hypothetical protein